MLSTDLVFLLSISLGTASNINSFVREEPHPVLQMSKDPIDFLVKTVGENVNTVQEQVSFDWPMGVVNYYADLHSFDYLVAHRLRIAMNMLEAVTCVKFKPVVVLPPENITWIHFTNPDHKRECFHEPIYKENGEIVMILGLDCLKRNDIMHTLLHAIGLKDEVSHPQRDQYIRILWENINPEYRHLFRIQADLVSVKTMVEYDSSSIMHFHDRAFSWNGRATIAPLVPGLIINPSPELSQLDKMKLRLLFSNECNKRQVENLLDTCKNVLHGELNSNSRLDEDRSENNAVKSVKSQMDIDKQQELNSTDIEIDDPHEEITDIVNGSKQTDLTDEQQLTGSSEVATRQELIIAAGNATD